MDATAMLNVDSVSKSFTARATLVDRFTGAKPAGVLAVDHVDMAITRGETFGLVGESGCGKSTLARIVAGLAAPDSGAIVWATGARRPRLQMIFQDPFSSLNARWTVGRIIAEPIRVHGLREGGAIRARVSQLLEQVGLSAADTEKYPQEFSGGQCQRISIARALAGEPDFLILDEPTSALDVSVQAQILSLLRKLQSELGLTCLFITHNLGVVRAVAQRFAVMYLGQIVEMNTTQALFDHPRHPYTKLLFDAAPDIDVIDRQLHPIPGDLSGLANRPAGCRFHTRCPWALDICKTVEPEITPSSNGFFRCHNPLPAQA